MHISKGTTSAVRVVYSKRVLTKVSNAEHQSNIQWRSGSCAASVPSDTSKPQRGKKRVTKNERIFMVASFVDKYRESNAGKFPTPSAVKKEVGGNYYFVRKIIQELEYNFKVQSMSKRHESVTKVEFVSSFVAVVDGAVKDSQSVTNGIGMNEASGNHVEMKKHPVSGWDDKALFDESSQRITSDDYPSLHQAHDHQIKVQTEEICPGKTENHKMDVASFEGLLASNSPKSEVMQAQEISGSDKSVKEISKQEINNDKLLKKSTLWGNLKSLADGIINLWRKS